MNITSVSKKQPPLRAALADGGAEAGMKVKTTRIYEYDPDTKIEALVS